MVFPLKNVLKKWMQECSGSILKLSRLAFETSMVFTSSFDQRSTIMSFLSLPFNVLSITITI